MSEKKYVGSEALIRLVAQLKAGFASLVHTHKLEDITDYTVDSALSDTSTNPVQNQALKSKFDAVNSAIAGKAASSHTHDDRYYTEDEVDEKISGITSGTIVVKEAEHAESADTATSATTATTATNATNANHAVSADTATSATSAASATKATKDGDGNVISSTYETKTDAIAKLAEAKEYTNTVANSKADTSHNHDTKYDAKGAADSALNSANTYTDTNIEALSEGFSTVIYQMYGNDVTEEGAPTIRDIANDEAVSKLAEAKQYVDDEIAELINSAPTTLDTLGEIATAMQENEDVVEALNNAVGSKANSSDLTSHIGNKSNPHGVTAVQVGAYTKAEVDATVSDLEDAISGKAAKATTLSGYGITDAYTKTQVDSALSGKAASGHTHDDRYYTEDEIDTKVSSLQSAIDGKAAASHGNHVPATQTANNAVFLRNDNTWATVTPANIGAATSGHTHKYAGSSSVGGAANSVANSIAIKLNGGTTEGTNLFTYNGSGAKTINITPASIGAQVAGSYAAASHTHDDRYYTESEIDSKVSALNTAISGKAASSHTHSISDISGLEARLAAIEAMLISITDTEIDEICG